ncbi:MAG TPA: response regulator [Bryobacteraceae bacterium]|nr:response regulator [Bryobacteraceae bacterium]
MISTKSEILLVEDSQDDADLALRALRNGKLNNNIHVVEDGEEALDYLFCRGSYADRYFEQPPVLVLLDLKLPKVSGIEVLEQVKRDPRTRTIPVVVMTSSSEDRDVELAFKLGANSYVQKPVDFVQFQETVKTVGLYWLVINRSPTCVSGA